jgi:hypothetical protein
VSTAVRVHSKKTSSKAVESVGIGPGIPGKPVGGSNSGASIEFLACFLSIFTNRIFIFDMIEIGLINPYGEGRAFTIKLIEGHGEAKA